MKKVTLVIDNDLMNLMPSVNNSSDDAAIGTAIKEVFAKAKKVDDLQAKHDQMKTEKDNAVTELANYKKDNAAKEVKALLDEAQEGDEPVLTNENRAILEKDYEGNPEGLKNVLKMLTPQKDIVAAIGDGKPKGNADLVAKFDELDESGKLEDLARNDFEQYRLLYKAKYNGAEPNKPKN